MACAPLIDEVVPSRSRARELLTDSGAFDAEWYVDSYGARLPKGADASALEHYLDVGWREGLAPNPWVDPAEVFARLGTDAHEPISLIEVLRGHLDLAGFQAGLDAARPCDLSRGDVELRWHDLISGQLPHEDTFVLYRIIGNDLPPRHALGQSERNLRFLLENEPHLPGCERRYVLNRIVDANVERRLLAVLREHDANVLHLTYEREAYRQIGWRVSDFSRPGLLYGTAHDALPEVNRARAIDHAFHDKNLHVMHNNGARNAALEEGRTRARWVLPFDGNCFFTTTAWEELRRTVGSAPHRRYLVVPMARVNDNDELLAAAPPGPATDEPQVAFRSGASERFDPDVRYGRRPKVELLRRLGVPGPWDTWPNEPWERLSPGSCNEAQEYLVAGWVARLASGRPSLEVDGRERMISRMDGIRKLLTEVDEEVLRVRFRASDPVFLDPNKVADQRTAGCVAGRPLVEAIDAEEAHQVDAAVASWRWRRFSTRNDDSATTMVATALAGLLLDDETRISQGAAAIHRLVVGGRSLSTLAPGQVAHLLDVARLLRARSALTPGTLVHLEARIEERRSTLLSEAKSGARRRALDATGVWFEVEHLAVASYLDDVPLMLDGLRRSASRLHDQFVLLPQRGGRWRRRVARTENLLAWGRLWKALSRWDITLCDTGTDAIDRYRHVSREVARRAPAFPPPLLSVPSDTGGPATTTLLAPVGPGDTVAPLWWAGVLAP